MRRYAIILSCLISGILAVTADAVPGNSSVYFPFTIPGYPNETLSRSIQKRTIDGLDDETSIQDLDSKPLTKVVDGVIPADPNQPYEQLFKTSQETLNEINVVIRAKEIGEAFDLESLAELDSRWNKARRMAEGRAVPELAAQSKKEWQLRRRQTSIEFREQAAKHWEEEQATWDAQHAEWEKKSQKLRDEWIPMDPTEYSEDDSTLDIIYEEDAESSGDERELDQTKRVGKEPVDQDVDRKSTDEDEARQEAEKSLRLVEEAEREKTDVSKDNEKTEESLLQSEQEHLVKSGEQGTKKQGKTYENCMVDDHVIEGEKLNAKSVRQQLSASINDLLDTTTSSIDLSPETGTATDEALFRSAKSDLWYETLKSPALVLSVMVGLGLIGIGIYYGTQLAGSHSNRADPNHDDIVGHAVSPAAMLHERCQKMNDLANKADGIAQDALTMKRWNTTMRAYEPIYYRSYELATLRQIRNISSTTISDWGTPAPLPVHIGIVSSPHQQLQIDKELDAWHTEELLRPLHMQHRLAEEYHRAVDRDALELIEKSSLPFAVNSTEFFAAYYGFQLRMGIPSHCHGLIKEGKVIGRKISRDRRFHALNKMQLNNALARLFAVRSAPKRVVSVPANVVATV